MTDTSAALDLESDTGAPELAREFLVTTCGAWDTPHFLEFGLLLVSELVTNAVLHANAPLHLALSVSSGAMTIGVGDSAPGAPQVVPPEKRGVLGGHGMALVERLAEAWGVTPSAGGGKVVWCRLKGPLPPGP